MSGFKYSIDDTIAALLPGTKDQGRPLNISNNVSVRHLALRRLDGPYVAMIYPFRLEMGSHDQRTQPSPAQLNVDGFPGRYRGRFSAFGHLHLWIASIEGTKEIFVGRLIDTQSADIVD